MKFPKLLLITIILSLFIVISISAQESQTSPLADQSWVRLGGSPGGIGYDIRFDPENPNIWYVTDTGAGLHKSIDNGITWFNTNDGIDVRIGLTGDEVPVFCVTVDPNNTNTIWVGLQGRRGVYRSDDRGQTWQSRTAGIIEDEGLTIRGIAVEPGNSDIIYVAGEISSWAWAKRELSGRQFDLVKGVVYKSEDGGLSWKSIWRGENLARYILIHPEDTNILYLSTGIFDREAANSDWENNIPGGEGVFKSYDGGKSWIRINHGLENLYIGSLAMHPANPDILLAAAGNLAYQSGPGIYLTIDGGEIWNKVGGGNDLTGITAVAFSHTPPYLGYAAGEISFYRSASDQFQDWESFYIEELGYSWGPQGMQPGIPIDIEVDVIDPMRVFVNNYEGGNFLSEDGGVSWISASDGYSGNTISGLALDSTNPAIVLTNGLGGMSRSLDGGFRWEGILPSNARGGLARGTIAISPHNSEVLLASTMEGMIFFSNDGGAHWSTRLNVGQALWDLYSESGGYSSQGVRGFEFSESNPEIVYAGFGVDNCMQIGMGQCPVDSFYSLLKSIDGGFNWEEVTGTPFDNFSVNKIIVDPENENYVWVSAQGLGVFSSTDGGKTWDDISLGLRSKDLLSIEVVFSEETTILASLSAFGMYRTDDGGNTWKRSGSGMGSEEYVSAITNDRNHPDIVYVASEVSGFYISDDGGMSWKQNNNGLENRSVRTIVLSDDGNTLYAGTNGGGVFRLSIHNQDYFDALRPAPTLQPTAEPNMEPTDKPQPTPKEIKSADSIDPAHSALEIEQDQDRQTDLVIGAVIVGAAVLSAILFLGVRRRKWKK